jgi:tetratricopeptide (TPR) repeat protein
MASPALIAELEKQFSENPRRVFARLANEYRKTGELERAIEICRAHVPQQPSYISGHIVLGQALFDDAQYGDARQTFETALALDPENLIALRSLGDIARLHGDLPGARDWYGRLLDVDPQNPEVLALLEAMNVDANERAPVEGSVGRDYVPSSSAATQSATPAEAPELMPWERNFPAEQPAGDAHAAAHDEAIAPTAEREAASDLVAEHEPLDFAIDVGDVAFDGAPETAAAAAPAAEPSLDDMPELDRDGDELRIEQFGDSLDDGAAASGSPVEADRLADTTEWPSEQELSTSGEWDSWSAAELPRAETAPELAHDEIGMDAGEPEPEPTQDELYAFVTQMSVEERDEPPASDAEPSAPSADEVAAHEDRVAAIEASIHELTTVEMVVPDADAAADLTSELELETDEMLGAADIEAAPAATDDAGEMGAERTPGFVTETMAELYLKQGFREEALGIYDRLLAQHPEDPELRARVEALRQETPPQTAAGEKRSSREWSEEADFAAALGFDTPVHIPPVVPAGGSDAGLLAELDAQDAATAAPSPASVSSSPSAPRALSEKNARAFFASFAARRAPARAAQRATEAALFGEGEASPADEAAAERLAAGFGGGGPATRAAGNDLSLDNIFAEGGAPPRGNGYSFDDFFAEAPSEQGGDHGDSPDAAPQRPAVDSADLEAFNAWLEGLKR